MKKSRLEIIVILLAFACLYGFLIKTIPWHLVFSNTMVSGGDTGSHNYVAWYSHEIFPKLKWWSPDWYAGFPFLYFYPPLLYYLNDILSFIIPFNVAFKIITLLGTLLLPLAVYLCLHLLDFQFPIPSLGAVLSLGYLFLEKFSIYGGNIPSTLAGEFSYSFGFALFFIFIGLLFRDLKKKDLSFITIIILSLMVLVHPFSVIAAILVGGLMFLGAIISSTFALLSVNSERKKVLSEARVLIAKEAKKTFWLLIKIFGLAFSLTAFWSLPFIALLGYASKMSWTKVINLEEIFPSSLIIFELLAGISLIYALIRRERRIFLLVYIMIASFIPFLLLNHSSIWNTRFLPFILMTSLMLAAYGLGSWFKDLGTLLARRKPNKELRQSLIASFLVILFSLYFLIIYLPATITYIPFWLKWNYEGFEKKTSWSEIEQLFVYLKTLPQGRIMWEYRGEYDKFGTPRILENLPIWTDHSTFEGLLIESSISGYFHFINQAETTKTPTAAIAGMQYPSFNFENGVKHLQLFGAQYFLAFTPEIKQLADQYLVKLKNINEFNVYQVPHSELVSLIPQIELKSKNKKWLDESINWYKEMDFSKFLVFYQNKIEFEEIRTLASLRTFFLAPLEITNSLKSNFQSEGTIIIKEIKKDSLTFKTENLYQPHLVKITYFPGWKVIGGKGPYLISPSFMMVIPIQREVTLQFGYNLWDKIGMIMFLVGLIIVILITRKPSRFLSNLKQKFLIPQD